MKAAIAALRRQQPARIIVAVPVGARESCNNLGQLADEVICLQVPDPFYAVGLWYENFTQTTDGDVRELLHKAATASSSCR